MSRRSDSWLSPLVALAVLVLAGLQTVGALGVTGAYGWQPDAVLVAVPPAYLAVDRALALGDSHVTLDDVRDPFRMRVSPPSRAAGPAARPRVLPPAVPSAPVLTAIVWDSDPRALVRWKDREWTIREGGLFDEFQVTSISRDQVSLRRGEATLVLLRRNPGD